MVKDFNNEIASFLTDKVGGIVIVDSETSEIVWADRYYTDKYGTGVIGKNADEVFGWNGDCPELAEDGAAVEWESIDIDAKRYYRFNSGIFVKDGRTYKIHQMTDITEYMGLNRDITRYMSFFKKLSRFQTAVLEKLSDTYYELLPMLAEYFKTDRVYFMIQREDKLDIITYTRKDDSYSNDRIDCGQGAAEAFDKDVREDISGCDLAEDLRAVLLRNGGSEDSTYRMLVSGEISQQRYAVYLDVTAAMDRESLNEPTLKSVIKLYIENGIMRDKLVYDSEHDGLTGLFNKSKYLAMAQKEFPYLDSIAVFNFDVNNLKKMNDTYGHEAGDRLIIKAADSFRKVVSNKVHAFRMGGDEFLVVACNVTGTEVDVIKHRWEEELERLNTYDDGIECVIAVGVVYAEGSYDYDQLLKQADAAMYEDKKRKKKPGEEIR